MFYRVSLNLLALGEMMESHLSILRKRDIWLTIQITTLVGIFEYTMGRNAYMGVVDAPMIS